MTVQEIVFKTKLGTEIEIITDKAEYIGNKYWF